VEIDPKQLPEDPSALRQMVIGLLEEAAERERGCANCNTGWSNCCGHAMGPAANG